MIDMPDRICCTNPLCSRTAPAEKHPGDNEFCCHQCWRLLPERLTRRYSQLVRRMRMIDRVMRRERRKLSGEPSAASFGPPSTVVEQQLDKHKDDNWREIHDFFRPADKPAGIEAFLEEIGIDA